MWAAPNFQNDPSILSAAARHFSFSQATARWISNFTLQPSILSLVTYFSTRVYLNFPDELQFSPKESLGDLVEFLWKVTHIKFI